MNTCSHLHCNCQYFTEICTPHYTNQFRTQGTPVFFSSQSIHLCAEQVSVPDLRRGSEGLGHTGSWTGLEDHVIGEEDGGIVEIPGLIGLPAGSQPVQNSLRYHEVDAILKSL